MCNGEISILPKPKQMIKYYLENILSFGAFNLWIQGPPALFFF